MLLFAVAVAAVDVVFPPSLNSALIAAIAVAAVNAMLLVAVNAVVKACC